MAGMPGSGAADPDAHPDPDPNPASSAWVPPDAPELVFWLGLVSAVGTLVHSVMAVTKQPRASSAGAAQRRARERSRSRASSAAVPAI